MHRRIVVKPQEFLLIFTQTLPGFGVSIGVGLLEVLDLTLGLLPLRCIKDAMQMAFDHRMQLLWYGIENIHGFMDGATLLIC